MMKQHFVKHRTTLILLAAGIAATLPLWIAIFPPMTDLPQHASQVALLRNIQDPNFRFASLFQINWLTPYLLGYLMVFALAPLTGIVLACKIIIALSLIALPIATAAVMRATGADPYWALLTLPLMYGFSYHWGFLNFIVAAPLGVIFLWAVIRHVHNRRPRTYVALAVLINVLFFSHALICAFFALIAALYMLVELKSLKRAFLFAWPLLMVLPLACFWFLRPHAEARIPTRWDLAWVDTAEPYYQYGAAWASHDNHPGWGRISGFVPRLLGVEPDPAYVVVALALFAAPLIAGARPSRRLALWVPFCVCVLVLLFAPSTLYGTAFIFQRFTLFSLPFFLMALEKPVNDQTSRSYFPRLVRIGSLAVVLIWIGMLCIRMQVYNASAEGFGEILRKMKPYERACSFDFVRDSDIAIAPVFAHYASWYGAEKQGMVDPHSAFWPIELFTFDPQHMPKVVFDFEWHPQAFDWQDLDGHEYRYFVVSARGDMGPLLFRHSDCPVSLVHHQGLWWLYEQDPACSNRAHPG